MFDLVQYLANGYHPVAVGGPEPSLDDLKERLTTMLYAFVKFTDTQGGTDLGVEVDAEATDLSRADFEHASGTVHVEGSLTLDFVPVRCVADIDLATMAGTGYLIAAVSAN
jgi:hypothetical protein